MSWLLTALCLAALLALSAFYSGSETALYTVNRFRLRQRQHRRDRSARVLARLLADPVGLLVTFLLGNNIVNYLITALVTDAYQRTIWKAGGHWWQHPDAAATLTVVLPLFILGEMLPKNYFRRHTERLSYLAAWGLAATRLALFPAVWALRAAANLVPTPRGPGAALGLPRLSRHMLDHLLSRGRETGQLTAEQERLARNMLRAGERRVAALAQAITSTGGTLTVPAGEKAGRVLQRMIEAHARLALVLTTTDASGDTDRSRSAPLGGLPVHVPAQPLRCRQVLGYVRLFDLLAPGVQGRPVEQLARPVPRLAAHAALRHALNVMQHECADVAIIEQPGRLADAEAAGARPGEGSGEPGCPILGVIRLPQLIAELLKAPTGG